MFSDDFNLSLDQDVIRANPVEDRMNGFFIACFEKKKC